MMLRVRLEHARQFAEFSRERRVHLATCGAEPDEQEGGCAWRVRRRGVGCHIGCVDRRGANTRLRNAIRNSNHQRRERQACDRDGHNKPEQLLIKKSITACAFRNNETELTDLRDGRRGGKHACAGQSGKTQRTRGEHGLSNNDSRECCEHKRRVFIGPCRIACESDRREKHSQKQRVERRNIGAHLRCESRATE